MDFFIKAAQAVMGNAASVLSCYHRRASQQRLLTAVLVVIFKVLEKNTIRLAKAVQAKGLRGC